MFNNISATVLFVEDLERSRMFYHDMLGMTPVFTDAHSAAYRLEEHDFVLLKIPAAVEMVGEEALSLGQGAGHRVLLCIGVKDVDAAYQSLTAKGLTFIKPPKSQDWGRRTAYFADPDGNLWELWHELPAEPK